jgi:hypothetical protein
MYLFMNSVRYLHLVVTKLEYIENFEQNSPL